MVLCGIRNSGDRGVERQRYGACLLFVGHENIADGLRTGAIYRSANVSSGVVDTGDFDKRYIVIDDNYPPYQVCTFDGPTDYYNDPAFKKLRLAAFVVPLYPRIYLEPIEAYSLALDVLENVMAVPCDARQVVTRFFSDIFHVVQELGGVLLRIAEGVERGYTGYIYAKVHLDNGDIR